MITDLEQANRSRPWLIVAHTDTSYTRSLASAFQRQGWDVYTAASGAEVRRVTRLLDPVLVVLDTKLPDESGWLTCAKLTREQSNLRVFLTTGANRVEQDFAAFAGAAGLIRPGDSIGSLLKKAEKLAATVSS